MENGYLLTAICVLASAVGVQWKVQYSTFKKLEYKIDKCEKDRLDLWARIASLSSGKCADTECPKYQKP